MIYAPHHISGYQIMEDWMGVVCMEKRNVYRVLVRKPI
jgi:hypothetical protein